LGSGLEIPAAIRVAAIAIKLYGVARAFAGSATEFAAFCRRAAAGWVFTDSFLLIVRHLLSSSNKFELRVVWRRTLAHSPAGLEAITGRRAALMNKPKIYTTISSTELFDEKSLNRLTQWVRHQF
jgi:hypothetical protein